MFFIDSIKKYGAVLAACVATSANSAEPLKGLIGGTIDSLAYAASITPSSTVPQPIPLSLSSPFTSVNEVAINASGHGLIGGFGNGSTAFAFKIDPSSNLTQILGFPTPSNIFSVAINNLGVGLVGGGSGTGSPTPGGYVAIISPSSNLPTRVDVGLNTLGDTIFAVDINNLNQGIVGGATSGGAAYAALITSGFGIPVTNLPATGSIDTVAINDSGTSLVGGLSGTSAYAALIPPSSSVATQIFLHPTTLTSILGVALNNSGQGLIGGGGSTTGGYAIFVSGNTITNILDLPTGSAINSVAINNSGQGLLAGFNGAIPYLARVAPVSNQITEISLGVPSGLLFSVAINDFGQGLIGGTVSGLPYAALVSANTVVPLFLNVSASGDIDTVSLNSLLPLLSNIPTSTLSGNNVKFANYINKNAPQDAIYFVPALFDGTLSDALESAAPTRNAISYNTVLQNSFYLTTSLATHLRDQHFIHVRAAQPKRGDATAFKVEDEKAEEQLLTSLALSDPKTRAKEKLCDKAPTFSLWLDAVGALAYQDRQHQTPGFNPATGGAILAFDGKVSNQTKLGLGASYLFTHIHEKQNAGHSDINQEGVFVYASWDSEEFYVDGALWGGWFQTRQKRKIEMTGFSFTSTSKPDGGFLTPHFEFGYNGTPVCTKSVQFTWNPFGMLDWANGWQESYKEKGTGPFNFKQKSHYGSLLRAEMGIRLTEVLFFQTWNLIFQEKGSYVNTQSFDAGKVHGFLVGSPGSFTVETLTSSQNLGVAQFLVTFAPRDPACPMGTIFYQGEFGSGYQSHQINLELGWNF